MPSDEYQFEQQNIVFRAQFVNPDGTPRDITGDTPIDMQFRKPDNTKVTENAITIVDALNGIVEYTEATNAKSNIKGAWEYRPLTASVIKGDWIQYIVHD